MASAKFMVMTTSEEAARECDVSCLDHAVQR
jgi:hypothetical protein